MGVIYREMRFKSGFRKLLVCQNQEAKKLCFLDKKKMNFLDKKNMSFLDQKFYYSNPSFFIYLHYFIHDGSF